MAVDTAAKRFSMMAWANGSVLDTPMIIPDGTIATADRQHFLIKYAGIAFGAPVVALALAHVNYWRERRLQRRVRPWSQRP